MYSPSMGAVATKCVSPEFHKLGRALAGGNVRTIGRAVFSHNSLREAVVTRLCSIADEECSCLCSMNTGSVCMFRSITLEQADRFEWSDLIHEQSQSNPIA